MPRRVAIVLVASLAAACGDSARTAPDATGGTDVVDAARSDAADVPQPDAEWGAREFDVHVFEAIQTTDLAGATVCVVGQSDCQITDASGDATVTVAGAPYDMKFAFVATAAGHVATVGLGRIYVQLDIDIFTVLSDLGLLTDAAASELFTAAGFAYPATSTGWIRATVFDGVATGPQVGATVTLDGSSLAPVYLDDDGRPDPTLTAIGPSGGVLFGDVPPGPFTLTVHVPNKVCGMQSYAWDTWNGTASVGSVAGVVVAGAFTDGITLACYNSN